MIKNLHENETLQEKIESLEKKHVEEKKEFINILNYYFQR